MGESKYIASHSSTLPPEYAIRGGVPLVPTRSILIFYHWDLRALKLQTSYVTNRVNECGHNKLMLLYNNGRAGTMMQRERREIDVMRSKEENHLCSILVPKLRYLEVPS
jgi:hypothetical protein